MSRIQGALLGALLLTSIAIAYAPVWGNGFVDYDDEPYIIGNQHVSEGLTASGFSWAWTGDDAPYWTPVAWLSLQFDAHFFSSHLADGRTVLSPPAFHGQSLLWHAASALLLFRLLYRLTGARGRSFLVAALFALHPMHVESVAWAIERKDVVSVFFGILTLCAYLRYLEKPSWRRYTALTAAYLLSLLSKPMLITLPFMMLLLDYWPLRRWSGFGPSPGAPAATVLKRSISRGLLLEKAPLFLLAALIAAVTLASRDRHGSLVLLVNLPLSDRLANAVTAYGWYLGATLYPLRLAVLYPHPHGNWSPLGVLVGAACLLLITPFALRQARRRPWLIVGWLWFVVGLAPVIGLAQGGAQAWADRFSYWPHVGLFIALVWELEWSLSGLPIPALVRRAAWATVLGFLAAWTWTQVGYWRNSSTLWEHALAVTEDNDRAHEHMSLCLRTQGRPDEADFHLREACRIQTKRLGSSPP
jgi:protein O-mannosyl-transferase